ncbi:MAG: hypothetical protein AAFV98_19115 [Chloroflexota bacterium]
MTTIATTDPITGETVLRTAEPAHPLMTMEMTMLEASANTLLADGEDTVTLTIASMKRSRARVRRGRQVKLMINAQPYTVMLNAEGKAEVTLTATEPGELLIQALEPAGNAVQITAEALPTPDPEPHVLGRTFVFGG